MLVFFLQLVLGAALAAGLVLYGRRFRRRGELKVYAIALIVAALIYVVFVLVGGDLTMLASELLGLVVFGAVAVLGGYRRWPAFLALGWAAHAGWDALQLTESATYVPRWYAVGCLGFDLLLAGYIALSRHLRLGPK